SGWCRPTRSACGRRRSSASAPIPPPWTPSPRMAFRRPRPSTSCRASRWNWPGRPRAPRMRNLIRNGVCDVVLRATPDERASGSIDLGVLAKGIYHFDFEGVGQIARDTIAHHHAVSVHDPFELHHFTASATRIKAGEEVVLSWSTTNATSAILRDDRTGMEVVIPQAELASGTLSVFPERTTTYTIEVESYERYRRAEVTVEVRTVWIDAFQASKEKIRANATASVDLYWNTSPNGTAMLDVPVPLVEVSPPFEDTITRHLPAAWSGAPSVPTRGWLPARRALPTCWCNRGTRRRCATRSASGTSTGGNARKRSSRSSARAISRSPR